MILRMNLVMGSLVIVMDDRRVLDHREGGGGIRQSKLVVRIERNLLLMRNGGHVLRMWPQVHRLTGFRHQIHDDRRGRRRRNCRRRVSVSTGQRKVKFLCASSSE